MSRGNTIVIHAGTGVLSTTPLKDGPGQGVPKEESEVR